MKPILILLFLLFSFTEQGFSQVLLGAKAGATFSAFHGEYDGFVTGKSYGFFFDTPPKKDAILSGAISYSERGGVLKDVLMQKDMFLLDRSYSMADFHIIKSYLEVSLVVKQKSSINQNLQIYPYMGFALAANLQIIDEEKTKLKNRIDLAEGSQPTSDYVTTGGEYQGSGGNFSFILGGALYHKKFLLDIRYYHSLTPIKGAHVYGPFDQKNFAINISLGYILTRDWVKTNKR